MYITDMKALRLLYTRKHLPMFDAFPTLETTLSFLSPRNPPIPRRVPPSSSHFYSKDSILSKPSSSETGQQSIRVWSIYDPITGETATHRGIRGGEDPQFHPSSSSLDTGFPDIEGERTYGRAKNANLSDGVKTERNIPETKNEAENFSKVKAGVRIKRGNSSSGSVRGWDSGDLVVGKKKGKGKTVWVCENCGHSEGQWWGSCRSCNRVGTVRRFSEGSETGGKENAVRSWLPQQAGIQPLRLTDVIQGINQLAWRIPLPGHFGDEVARVLGGGLAPGSLVLIGGDPGVGKSTLLLQMAAIISERTDLDAPSTVLYVSGEESVEQIGSRADRMRIETEELFLYSSTDIEDILAKAHVLSPRALIIDSIQTVYLKEVTGSAGGLSQVRECTSALLRFAKKTNIPILLVGHVTKAGDIAGPRVLEHIVDVVLYMEGEECSSHRLLRSVKNRFGSTDELGVFEMSQSGLQVVSNPSGMFLSEQYPDSEVLAGLAVAVVMDGSRSFLIEIQALCVSGSTVMRHVNGIQPSRADMIISVLMKQAGLRLQENAIFLNIVSGIKLTETAGDLAIAVAICSSFLELPIPHGVAFIGEIGLGGELRKVPRMEKRVSTVAKLGYKKCLVPKSAEKSLEALGCVETEIIGCKNLKEVISAVFKKGD